MPDRIAPLRRARGSNVWQFNENEELSRVLLDQAVAEGTFSAISSFHFGSEFFLRTQPFLNRYRDVLPFVGLQDSHTQTWWWMEYLVAFRTFFPGRTADLGRLDRSVAPQLGGRLYGTIPANGFQTQVAGGSNAVRKHVMQRQAQWRWWGPQPSQMIRPLASMVVVTPDETVRRERAPTMASICACAAGSTRNPSEFRRIRWSTWCA